MPRYQEVQVRGLIAGAAVGPIKASQIVCWRDQALMDSLDRRDQAVWVDHTRPVRHRADPADTARAS
jgi:hypothetical protein